MKTFVLGDLHGNLKALKQCLERSKFDKENDVLISLGDIADGWHEVYECVEELLTIKNLVVIKGNHDDWMCQWVQTGSHPDNWRQGGEGTLKSYCNALGYGFEQKLSGWLTSMTRFDIPENHRKFWIEQLPYFKDQNNNLFIHGGFNRHFLLSEQLPYTFWWDRDLWSQALSYESMDRGALGGNPQFKIKEHCNEIFIGHTSTEFWKKQTPMHAANIWNLDTGAGWNGKLTFMDLDTKEYFQSDTGSELYPGMKGR